MLKNSKLQHQQQQARAQDAEVRDAIFLFVASQVLSRETVALKVSFTEITGHLHKISISILCYFCAIMAPSRKFFYISSFERRQKHFPFDTAKFPEFPSENFSWLNVKHPIMASLFLNSFLPEHVKLNLIFKNAQANRKLRFSFFFRLSDQAA